ncbi:MAG: ABC transporter ATP-binding protein [Lysinibacillus sp.]
MNEMDPIIDVQKLVKNYSAHQAVKGISFQVARGSLFAFLGTNGAGKSTTIEMLCTLLEKSSGTVTIDGVRLGSPQNNAKIRKSIGIVFQESLLDPLLTVKENILHRGRLYGFSKETLADNWQFVRQALQLGDIERRKYGTLSGGQRRRADIARAIIHKPVILFLDEPTTGLDPQTRVFVWEAIKRLQEETDMTIFLTTHYMEEAAVADEIVIIKEGKIVAAGTPHSLKERYASDCLSVVFTGDVAGTALLEQKGLAFTRKNEVYHIPIRSTFEGLQLAKELEPVVSSLEIAKGSMDDVFITINEEEIQDEHPHFARQQAQ